MVHVLPQFAHWQLHAPLHGPRPISNSLPSTSSRIAPLRLFVQPLPSMDTPLLPRGLPQPLPSSAAAGHSPRVETARSHTHGFHEHWPTESLPDLQALASWRTCFPAPIGEYQAGCARVLGVERPKGEGRNRPCLFAWSSTSSPLCCGGWSRRCMCMLVSRQTRQRCAPIRP